MSADTKANRRSDAAIEGHSTQPAGTYLSRRARHQELVIVHTVRNGPSQAGIHQPGATGA